jgi:hypothetical protein
MPFPLHVTPLEVFPAPKNDGVKVYTGHISKDLSNLQLDGNEGIEIKIHEPLTAKIDTNKTCGSRFGAFVPYETTTGTPLTEGWMERRRLDMLGGKTYLCRELKPSRPPLKCLFIFSTNNFYMHELIKLKLHGRVVSHRPCILDIPASNLCPVTSNPTEC